MCMSKESKLLCGWLITIPIMFICFCLSFQNHKPKCYIVDLYVPALNTYTKYSNNTRANTFIFFDLQLENVMPFNGLRYDNVNLTFSYNYGAHFLPIAHYTAHGFYQGMAKTAHKRDVTNAHGFPWVDAFDAVSNGSMAVLRVELSTKVRSKQYFWYATKHRLTVQGDMEVGSSGLGEHHKAIRLK